jgi:hypothetical protein
MGGQGQGQGSAAKKTQGMEKLLTASFGFDQVLAALYQWNLLRTKNLDSQNSKIF